MPYSIFLRRTLIWLAVGSACGGVEPARSETETGTETGTETESETEETEGVPVTPGARPGVVLLVGSVPTATACDAAGATGVQWQATRVGCVDPFPAPCTLPPVPRPVEGDRFTCPQSDPTVLLGIEVDQAGRYTVEAVLGLTGQEPRPDCYATDGSTEILVTEAQLVAGGVVTTTPTGLPCP